MLGLGMSDANYHPIMCCHLWLISHVKLARLSTHLTRLSALPHGNYWEQPASSLGGARREKAYHKHWDRLSVSIQECIQSRSSDADLGWLWAPPMNLSCMAFKIKANKERFGRLGIVPAPCPSLTSQQFSPEWRSGAGDITILSVAPDQIWYLYTPSDHQAAGSLTKPSVIGKLGTKHKMFVDSVFYWA